ncbi:MAG: VOC family protein [Acidimicrobiia bacterium]|nr:VOC family protein [Acidimicrobiia bacterium]
MGEQINKRDTAVAPLGVNHIVLHVRDIDESHRFWSELLGFRQVGELHPKEGRPNIRMRFYSGVVNDDVNHHDIALIERPELPAPSDEWSMFVAQNAINHIAITYPDRESWLEQVQFLTDNGVEVARRVNHGMTHSIYIADPNGYGVEVLYELPEDVWKHDIDGALNWAENLPTHQTLVDTTDYATDFTSAAVTG